MKLERIQFVPRWWVKQGVNDRKFFTQNELKKFIRNIINSSPLEKPLSITDRDFLIGVIRRHPDFILKQGDGIDYIFIRINSAPGYAAPTRGLWIRRIDGSEIDISWTVTLTSSGKLSAKDEIFKAARFEISDQINNFRIHNKNCICEICGNPVLTGHVDHKYPFTFEYLITSWLKEKTLSYEDILLTSDVGFISTYKDRELAENWKNYHKLNSYLRLIHFEENLSLGNRKL